MKKVVYIIPGYGETHLKQRSYKKIALKCISCGIEPIYVSIDWHKTTPENFDGYLKEFRSQYKKPKDTKVYVLGFSFGAMIAFLTAAKTKPDGLILCSLSPYYIEDLPSLKPAWVKWFQDTFTKSIYSFHTYASKITTQTYIVVGDKEGDECMNRAKKLKRSLKRVSWLLLKKENTISIKKNTRLLSKKSLKHYSNSVYSVINRGKARVIHSRPFQRSSTKTAHELLPVRTFGNLPQTRG